MLHISLFIIIVLLYHTIYIVSDEYLRKKETLSQLPIIASSIGLPKSAPALHIPSYLGRWYKMYSSRIQLDTIDKNGSCITSLYFNPMLIGTYAEFSLINTKNKGGPKGSLSQKNGIAQTYSFQETPGQWNLKLNFSNSINYFPYWILKVGDLSPYNNTCISDVPTCYAWAIVSDPFRATLSILARDVDEFKSKYKSTVLGIVNSRGYTTSYNQPIEIYQSSTDCVYVPIPI